MEDGFDIRLMCQPLNSPDLNVLDLDFFNANQSLQYKETPRTIDELVQAVTKSFGTFSSVQSNKIFLTLQTCMVEIMKARGSNKYSIPHIMKAVLQKEGGLPTQIKCDPSLVEEVIHHLRHIIELQAGIGPISVRPYRYPYAYKDEIEKQVNELLQQGVTRNSSSSFSSSMILVKKKNCSWFICVDYYRTLNKVTILDKYPMSRSR